VNSRYQKKLQKQFLKSTLIPLFICIIIIIIAFYTYVIGYNYYNLNHWMDEAGERAESIYRYYYSYLVDKDEQRHMRAFIDGEISQKMMNYHFKTGCKDEPVDSDMILLDKNGEAVYFSNENDSKNMHLKYYSSLLYLLKSPETVCESRNYYFNGDYAKWILYVALYDDRGEDAGAAVICIGEKELMALFKKSGYEVIMTDKNNQAVMSTDQTLLDKHHSFSYNGSGRMSSDRTGYTYIADKTYMGGLDGYIYILIQIQDWSNYYLIVCVVMLIFASIIIVQSGKFAKSLADDSAKSLEKLYSEFTMVQKDPKYQISMQTNDEFEEIGEKINMLISNINELSEKNLILERKQGDMEKAQIKSRFHPHFIYNALESIRFSILINDNNKANKILLKLTELLRYSVDNTHFYMTLEEDMEHIAEYLDIMRFRYGERFTYTFDIAEDTKNFLIPPLFIQPLVENSLKYGFGHKENLHIDVAAWMEGSLLHVRVRDDGTGLTGEQLEKQRQLLKEGSFERGHFGISLIARHLKLQYGEESTIEIDSVYGGGTTVEIKLEDGSVNGGFVEKI